MIFPVTKTSGYSGVVFEHQVVIAQLSIVRNHKIGGQEWSGDNPTYHFIDLDCMSILYWLCFKKTQILFDPVPKQGMLQSSAE